MRHVAPFGRSRRALVRARGAVRTPEGAATAVSISVLVLMLVVQVADPGVWARWGWLVLVVALVAGLPHGAVDHVVPGYLLRERAPRLLLVVSVYALTALVAWAVFRTFPAVGLVLFVALSVLHFGAGEVAFAQERDAPGERRYRVSDMPAVVAAGGAVLLLPVLREPATSAPLIALLVPGSSGRLSSWVATTTITLVLIAAAVTGAGHLHRRRWLSALEITLLTAVGLLVAPLAAFGAYFGAWHSMRHIGRMVAADPANTSDLARGRLLRPTCRFASTAAAPTALSLAGLLALWALAGGWRGFITADLALLAGLTVPHVVLVAWWDRHDATTVPA